MAKNSNSKGGSDFTGIGDSTPSADPTPNKGQGGFERRKLDFRGVEDSTPNADGVSEKIKLGK